MVIIRAQFLFCQLQAHGFIGQGELETSRVLVYKGLLADWVGAWKKGVRNEKRRWDLFVKKGHTCFEVFF